MIIRVGVISDTHGLLRDEALEALPGSDHIVHAGDIGDASIVDALAAIALVTAVRRNNDNEPWADGIPHSACLRVGDISMIVLHDLNTLASIG